MSLINGALARIIMRYIIGAAFVSTSAIGDQLATDPDVVMAATAAVGVVTETLYVFAKKRGWTT